MKKTIAIIMALALSAGSITAFADEEIDVNGKYVAGNNGGTVYRYDITWDDMTFTYTDGDKEWNPDTHKYDSTEGKWSADTKTITVTNHSNAEIAVEPEFSSAVDGLSGKFDKDGFVLVSAEGTAVENAPSDSIEFSVSGAGISADGKIGTISINILA